MTEIETTFVELKETLLALFRKGVEAPLEEEAFNRLALRIYRFQLRANPVYGAFLRRRIPDPQGLERWEEIPPLPTRAFKAAPLVAGDPEEVEAVFRTSGTTRGRSDRGIHRVRSLDLYRGALAPNFQAHLLPEGRTLPILALLPSPREAPDSSLSFMVGEMGGEGSGFFWDPDHGLRLEEFREALARAEAAGDPVLLAGTAFALAAWLDAAGQRGISLRLPPGTRVMETGGFKGRVRSIPREEFYQALSAVFGVDTGRIVNEYGMTELLSQFYEPVLAEDVPGDLSSPGSRYHRGPSWVRSRVLHPLTLEEVGEGDVGILAHFDLANLGSVSAVLTEDLARRVPGGFRLKGRSPGAEPRGCSLAMEDFLEGMKGGGHGL